jgi:hypothetical protein
VCVAIKVLRVDDPAMHNIRRWPIVPRERRTAAL